MIFHIKAYFGGLLLYYSACENRCESLLWVWKNFVKLNIKENYP